jgi:hypothetical protein
LNGMCGHSEEQRDEESTVYFVWTAAAQRHQIPRVARDDHPLHALGSADTEQIETISENELRGAGEH